MDEQGYHLSFLASRFSGRFHLVEDYVPTLFGFYWIWGFWADIFGTSIEVARMLTTVICVIGFWGLYQLACEWAPSRRDALLAATLTGGLPFLYYSHYLLSDPPFLTGTVWFWVAMVNARKKKSIAWLTFGFTLTAYLATIRQLGPVLAAAGVLYLFINEKWSGPQKFSILILASTSIAATLAAYSFMEQDPHFITSDRLLALFGGSNLFKGLRPRFGAMLLAAVQMLTALSVVFSGIWTLGLFDAIVSRRWLSRSSAAVLCIAALILGGSIFSVARHKGLRIALANFAFSGATIDYGVPPLTDVSNYALACVIAGFVVLILLLIGMAYGATILSAIKDRIDAITCFAFVLPALVAIVSALRYGMQISPRYLLPALVCALFLLCRALKTRTIETYPVVVALATALIAINIVMGLSTYHDALELVAKTWDLREQRWASTHEHPRIEAEPFWWGGHKASQSVVEEAREHVPDYWRQDGPATLALKCDTIQPDSNPDGILIDLWLPPRQLVGTLQPKSNSQPVHSVNTGSNSAAAQN